MKWVDIGSLKDIPVRGARLVKTSAGCVAVFRTGEEEVFAASDTCPHRGGPLSEGIVHGHNVTCPLHNYVYSLETGESVDGQDLSIPTYPVKIENDRILLDTESLGTKAAA